MPDEPPREIFETLEYTAQFDEIVARHTLDVVGPILTGLVEGIAKTPRASIDGQHMDDKE
jgi:hypothetical protein